MPLNTHRLRESRPPDLQKGPLMTRHYGDIAFTPSVTDAQNTLGSGWSCGRSSWVGWPS